LGLQISPKAELPLERVRGHPKVSSHTRKSKSCSLLPCEMWCPKIARNYLVRASWCRGGLL